MSERFRLLYLADEPNAGIPGVLFPADPLAYPHPEVCQTYETYLFGPTDDNDVAVDGMAHFLELSRTGVLWNPLARLKVLRLINRLRPDALLVRGAAARVLGIPAAKALGVPIRQVLATDLGHWLTLPVLRSLVRANEQVSRFVTDSFIAAQRLIRQEQAHRNQIDIMRWGVDVSRYGHRSEESVIEAKHRLGLSAHQPLILASGRYAVTQDYDTLLFAIRQMLPHQKDVRLVIWGTGGSELPAEIRAGIKRHGLEEHVIEPPPSMSLETCIAAADVGVVTSYVESCSPYLLSYMAAGLPSVAVNVGGNNELLVHGESGYLVDFKDADQLAMFITILLLSPELAERFGGAARARVLENYSMDAALRTREDFFRMMAYNAVGAR
jgi:glycosyltransferase involved in cell wall biosynthesis